jgi:hypothetical protein
MNRRANSLRFQRSILALAIPLLAASCGHSSAQSAAQSAQGRATATPPSTRSVGALPPTGLATNPTSLVQPINTATPTALATSTPTPDPKVLLPGLYHTQGCVLKPLADGTLTTCVEYVEIKNGSLDVVMSWEMRKVSKEWVVTKPSFANSQKYLYFIDEFGQRYNFTGAGGGATQALVMKNKHPIYGWFGFPIPTNGAKQFTFYDDGLQVSYKLRLTDREVVQAQAVLTRYPLQITYYIKNWELAEDNRGALTFLDNRLAGCTLTEVSQVSAEAKYKSTMSIGEINYAVYGWSDPANQRSIRDYVATWASEGDEIKPVFEVTIPAETDVQCLSDLDELLSSMEPSEPGVGLSSPTPGRAPTLDPNVLLPGLYHTQGCAIEPFRMGGELKTCVEYAEIEDGSLKLVMSWTLKDNTHTIYRQSAKAQHNPYIIDEFGRRYGLTGSGGAAVQELLLQNDVPMFGWFSFPVPMNGAKHITFYDLAHINIELALTAREVVEATARLTKYPLQLTYLIRNWEVSEGELGAVTLSDTRLAGCAFSEVGEGAPEAKYKNTVTIGDIEYEIYGWSDPANQRRVRDYVATPWLQTDGSHPVFQVTIPAGQDVECLTHLDELLSAVELAE